MLFGDMFHRPVVSAATVIALAATPGVGGHAPVGPWPQRKRCTEVTNTPCGKPFSP